MTRRFSAVLFGLVLAWTIPAGPARSDPVPLGLGVGAALVVAANLIFDLPEPDADRAFLNFGGGGFDAIDQDNGSAIFQLDYWAPTSFLKTRLVGGVFGTTDKGLGGYVGIRHDMHLGENIVVSVETGPALYASGDGNRLGSYALLRSGGGVAIRFANAGRLSLMLHHMSHGGLFSDKNPGVETVTLTYAIPIASLFGK